MILQSWSEQVYYIFGLNDCLERHVDHIHQRSRYFVTITNNQGIFIFQKQPFGHTGSNVLKEILAPFSVVLHTYKQ